VTLAAELVDAIASDPVALERLAEQLKPLMATDDGWLGMTDAAAYAGCTVPALRYAMASGDIEYEQRVAGGKVYFRRSALDRWRMSATPEREVVTRPAGRRQGLS
jgi:Helix-turn-helix domain